MSDSAPESFLRAGIRMDKKHCNHNIAKPNRSCNQQLMCVGMSRRRASQLSGNETLNSSQEK